MPRGDDGGPEPEVVTVHGETRARVHLGEEGSPGESPCPGCGAYFFALHAWGCEHEPCPVCGGALVDCSG